MSILILLTLIAGVVAGYFMPVGGASLLDSLSSVMLVLLIFSVGIDIGLNKQVFGDIKKLGVKILLVPAGVVIGSLLGGAILSIFFQESLKECLAIVSGLGWYSLSGILITESGNALGGAVSFLSNVFREMITFIIVPWIANHLNDYAAIAPAGATAMDTTLAVISRNTNGKIAVVAFVSGITCTLIVPLLVPIFL